MLHQLKPDFIDIARRISAESKSLEEWAAVESCDMFQQGDYVGGFDATEMEFTFSLYKDTTEFWFQIPLSAVLDVARGARTTVEIRVAGT